ncbi:acyl carrier protein [Candidatus Odyssella acanthamoebae]|uniref:Acyl carrier protein n=1 Tax=Candidatus Odyssella acanthamoebae TaxID=91604 RepID=A0A077AT33_9PROT|nr:acyl carrier protein [Candidatus Paracaedibacter acanthamoebae]AIK96367.1 acyl carrier protein [Candidatus Paracaedibacter acanthamoebae]
MTKNEIFNQISDYLEEYFEIPRTSITLEAKLFEELDLDSIDAVDLIVKLQELAKKKISPTEFKQVRIVGDVVNKVHDLVHQE